MEFSSPNLLGREGGIRLGNPIALHGTQMFEMLAAAMGLSSPHTGIVLVKRQGPEGIPSLERARELFPRTINSVYASPDKGYFPALMYQSRVSRSEHARSAAVTTAGARADQHGRETQ